VVLPGIILTIVAIWPFIEARLTGDDLEHHLLDRVGDHPIRTATGVAILTLFGVLTLAGGNDVIAFYFSSDVETLTLVFRALALALPVLAWVVTYRVCVARLRRDSAHGRSHRGGTALRRSESGGFEEVEP
jgi:ubiquinol-cytochrome c reductase cytochrome b subunit